MKRIPLICLLWCLAGSCSNWRVTLKPGRRMVGWASSVIAHDNGVILEDAGNEALVMALQCRRGGFAGYPVAGPVLSAHLI